MAEDTDTEGSIQYRVRVAVKLAASEGVIVEDIEIDDIDIDVLSDDETSVAVLTTKVFAYAKKGNIEKAAITMAEMLVHHVPDIDEAWEREVAAMEGFLRSLEPNPLRTYRRGRWSNVVIVAAGRLEVLGD
jgi:hypothetical protein